MEWLFGTAFAEGGDALALLVWGAPAFLVLSVASAILVAEERATTTAALTLPMVPAALAGYVLAVPRFGIRGAAAVTSAIAVATALASLVAAARLAGARLPAATVVRTAAASALAWCVARAIPVRGAWLLLALTAATLSGLAALLLLGESRLGDLRALLRWMRERRELRRKGAATEPPLVDDPA
jgi:O-antigen/teichoic acid export membrane protein